MAFASYDAIITALTNGNNDKRTWFKVSATADAVGVPVCMWAVAGNPTAGSTPATGAGTVPTRDTAGAIYMKNADVGEDSFITMFGAGGASQNHVWLVDMLWFNSGLSGTLTTAQTINSSALTRYTAAPYNYEDLNIGLICWTATGGTASNVTVSYTNEANTAGRTTASVALWTGGYGGGTVAPTANQFQMLPLQSGDKGVRSIQSLTLSASTTVAGNFGACIFKKLCEVSYPGNGFNALNLALQYPQLQEKLDSACLALIVHPNTTTTGIMHGRVEMAETV